MCLGPIHSSDTVRIVGDEQGSEIITGLPGNGTGVIIRVKAVPGARRTRVAGALGDRLKVQVAAPPEDGRANSAICQLLAELLGVRPGAVMVNAGMTSPQKTLHITGIDVAAARARLGV